MALKQALLTGLEVAAYFSRQELVARLELDGYQDVHEAVVSFPSFVIELVGKLAKSWPSDDKTYMDFESLDCFKGVNIALY